MLSIRYATAGCLLACACLLALHAAAQDQPRNGAAEADAAPASYDLTKRGLFTATFTERSDDSKPSALGRAFGSGAVRGFDDYDIAKQTFSVFVPKDYSDDRAHGLVIWLGDGDDGGLPRGDWDATLNRFKLIYIAPHNAGKAAPPAKRLALALDALHNAGLHYTIDPGRVYAAGYGEAAQLAALLLGAMPESFSGAIYVNGAAPPPGRGRAAQHIREHARIGFLIGEKSQAREQADKVFEEQYKEQFKHLERQVARVTAENMPTNRYFESTIFALEKPLAESAKDLLASAVRSKRGRKYEEAWRLFAAAAARSVDDAVVQQADKGIEALRAELDAELAKVAQIQQAGNEAGVRTATAKLEREWGRWGRMGVEKVQRGELPAAAASAPAGDAATPSVERPAAAANDTAAPQPPSPDRPQRSPRDETALRRLEAARGQLIDEPVEAYEAFEGIVKLYAGTPAARAAAIELAQLDADPDKGPAIAVALAERRARALLSLAKSYQQAGGKPQAREALRELLEKYPNSAQVVEAKLMMMELGEP